MELVEEMTRISEQRLREADEIGKEIKVILNSIDTLTQGNEVNATGVSKLVNKVMKLIVLIKI